jgi:HlyD family secretion protein
LESLVVSRGQNVKEGQSLFVLEHAREKAAVSEAQQGVAKAENILADLEKGKRPSEISAIEARLEQARISYDLSKEVYERREVLLRKNSLSQEEVDRTRTDMEHNAALIAQISAELVTAKLSARSDLVDAARSDLDAARYRLQQASWQLEQKSQVASAAGFVFDTFFREGEFVPAARPVVSLLPASNIKILFFVPENVLSTLAIGNKVSVSLDGAQSPLHAVINYISPQAEYTPPVIYSRETRSKLVFMIEAVVPDLAIAAGLHPGQPVDVRLENTNG